MAKIPRELNSGGLRPTRSPTTAWCVNFSGGKRSSQEHHQPVRTGRGIGNHLRGALATRLVLAYDTNRQIAARSLLYAACSLLTQYHNNMMPGTWYICICTRYEYHTRSYRCEESYIIVPSPLVRSSAGPSPLGHCHLPRSRYR